MSFQPVAKRSLPDEVFHQLVGGIVTGELVPGETLPAERKLAEALGVSRPAVREALQRLAQSGLVDVRQGDGTTVRDFRRSAGPDLLVQLLMPGGTLDLPVARSIIEARSLLGPHIARLAAERGGVGAADLLDPIVAELRVTEDAVALQRHALAFWDCLVDASDNITFRLMFNALRAAYEPVLEAMAEIMRAEVGQADSYAAIADSVRERNGSRAEATARGLMRAGSTAVIDAIDQLLADGADHEEIR